MNRAKMKSWTRYLVGMLLASSALAADKPATIPALWGYGMKPCADFLAAAPADALSIPLADEDYRRYREWLAGLVTGLNLTTGRDVLRDAELDAAMIRIRVLCAARPDDDFFNASLRLIRSLGQLDAAPAHQAPAAK
ncbi:hypothetical protein [Chromatium okenii]|jgi:hypothetical protein|uniref:hypothetical protein n=1 Tax=Chromatium okenii TaxID=61644 RepID=UPI0026ED698D|nr:hypothetical protein [Chromatium okenii]MBV5309475.1 hypothetical protein [Chromatium okenii]